MKILKGSFFTIFLYIIYISGSVNLISCTKTKTNTITNTVYDTTVVIKTDTLIVRDSIYDITDGLVAYYNFNGGNLNDSSGYGNNIVFNNATPTTDRFGNANNAYLFDGSSNYMRVTSSPSLSPTNITLMAIIKVNGFYNGACGGNQILGKEFHDGDPGQYFLRYFDYVNNSCVIAPDTTKETFGAVYSTTVGVGTADSVFIKTGIWYNLIFTYNGFQGKLYINGQLKKIWTATSDFTPNSNDLLIGAGADQANYPFWFDGVIDEIRIYNRALPFGAINELSQLKE